MQYNNSKRNVQNGKNIWLTTYVWQRDNNIGVSFSSINRIFYNESRKG